MKNIPHCLTDKIGRKVSAFRDVENMWIQYILMNKICKIIHIEITEKNNY